MFKAIVIGGTGATGHQLIKELVKNNNCERVTSIGRRPVLNGDKHDKLSDIVIDSLSDLSSTSKYWENNDFFFNCIGTTRKRAGGAKQFVDIELGISKEAAKMASKSKVPYAALVSADGANHKKWATHWIHPLLYIKTMGQKEQTIVSDYSFDYVAVFKPGMLIRLQDTGKWFDNILKKTGVGLEVDILASAMINVLEKASSSNIDKPCQYFIGNDKIKKSLD